MTVHFDLIDVMKTRTTACSGDAVAWILSSLCAYADKQFWSHCILVQPNHKVSSQIELDRLTTGVREEPCSESLEEWLDGLSGDLKDASFYVCLDLPPFSKASHQGINALLDAIDRNATASRPTICGVSPNLGNWLNLPLHGFIHSEFNASEFSGVHVAKFFVGFTSPSAGACIDIMEFEDVVRDRETPAMLLQGIWDCDRGSLWMSPSDLEFLKGSASVVVVSASTPFHLSASRSFVNYLMELATSVEYVHVMTHCGILQDPEMPSTKGEVAVHFLCTKVRWDG